MKSIKKMINRIFKNYLLNIGQKITIGDLTITLPNNENLKFSGKGDLKSNLKLNSYMPLIRTVTSGHVGFAESYIKGEWTSSDLESLLEIMVTNLPEAFNPKSKAHLLYNRTIHFFRENTKSRAKKNIQYHYDLGNDFYKLWLDKTMTYSSAIFKNEKESLQEAQENKYQALIDNLDIKPHHKVLEIGCGWGGFAEYAGKNVGCSIKGITISPSQLKFASNRIKESKLENKVSIELCDYRDLKGKYDRVVSIEMIEAVGEKYWKNYFEKIKDVLNKDGMAGIQVILINNGSYQKYSKSVDFIQKYVFPGGMLPSQDKLNENYLEAGLVEVNSLSFGKSYAKTLTIWHKEFLNSLSSIKKLGFDIKLERIFKYYFSYCKAGFNSEKIDVAQKIIKLS
ncbi:MAG: SAM-dependent methyltransferase [Rhodobiaceae bacterium]|nr:SAM-dependent methyltransferase [Rhodobiaceae bacterium]|tara:strand:+ start:2376 stop:3563 length:1188 start_codon:yes stop_codon:yes gene_type:complete